MSSELADYAPAVLAALQIIWIDILLSGDNAVVIALACRSLPPGQRRWGMLLGAGAAVGLRVIFTLVVVYLISTPFLKLVGGLLLLWIAVKLIVSDDEDKDIPASNRLWKAVRTIVIADAVMSLDNVVAIAAIAKDNIAMLIFGLAVSIPLIVAGAGLIMRMLERLPVLVWAGAALLGWVAGGMMISDPWLARHIGLNVATRYETLAALAGALVVIVIARLLVARQAKAGAKSEASSGS